MAVSSLPKDEPYYNLISNSILEPTALYTEYLKHSEADLLPRLSDGPQRLIEAVSRLYGVPQDGITLTNGVSNGIFLVCRTFIEPGDEVLVETPGYEPFSAAARLAGAEVKPLPRRPHDYLIDPDEVASLVTPRTRLIIISNLHNPSMTQIGDDLILETYEKAHQRNSRIKLLVDEIFHDFVRMQPPAARMGTEIMSLGGLSKVYGLGALHIGWILARPHLGERIRKIQIDTDGGGGTRVTAAIASQVLEHVDDYDRHWGSILQVNRPLVQSFMEPLVADGLAAGHVPADGSVMFPALTRIKDASEMSQFISLLNDKYRVYVVPGQYFQGPTHIRIGYGGPSEALRVGLERLGEAIREYARSK